MCVTKHKLACKTQKLCLPERSVVPACTACFFTLCIRGTTLTVTHITCLSCAFVTLANINAGGQYQGRIRSLCQFFNSTDLVLEVALLQDDDTSWTLLPQQQQQQSSSAGGASFSSAAGRLSGSSQQAASAASLSSSSGRVGDVVEEEVFEYERYLPLRGWSPDHLSSLDPRQYCRSRNGSHGTNSFPRVPLPPVSVLLCGCSQRPF